MSLRRVRALRFASAACLWLVTLHAEAQPSARDKAAAEALFQEGKALFDQGQYEAACAKFAASQQLDAGFGTLMNLGECYERRGMTASAWATFKEAASLARSAGQGEREAAARARAAELEAGLSRLVVSAPPELVAVEGLEVRLNGTLLPRAVWGSAVPVDPGVQRLEVSAAGYEPWSTELTIASGAQPVRVDVPPLTPSGAPSEPSPGAAGSPPATREAPPAALVDDGQTQRTLGYVLVGAGAVGLTVGSVFGLRAIAKNNDSEDRCRTPRLCSQAGLDLRDEAKSAATISTVAFVAGGALAASGLALMLTASSAVEGEPGRASGERRVAERAFAPRPRRLASHVSPAGVMVSMEGSW